MSWDADWPWRAPDFFMLSSWKIEISFNCKTVADRTGFEFKVTRSDRQAGSFRT
jgi:hypothetical protein